MEPDRVHREVLPMFVTPGLKYDIVIGMPWLKTHNPVIDWENGAFTFKSVHCSRHCLSDNGGYPISFDSAPRQIDNQYRRSAKDIIQDFTPIPTAQPLSINAAAFYDLAQQEGYEVFTASIEDIQKALAPKKAPTDPKTVLPSHYHEFLPLFDRSAAERLPVSRPGVDHQIRLLPGTQPPAGLLYRMNRDELEVLHKTLTDLLARGLIRPSQSPAASPVIFVRKPGGGLRFCVDYRGLNDVTVKNRYPLPLIQETLERLSKAVYFTKLDVVAAFHKIRIAAGDEWKTAFRTRQGLFEWMVMPFGSAMPLPHSKLILMTL